MLLRLPILIGTLVFAEAHASDSPRLPVAQPVATEAGFEDVGFDRRIAAGTAIVAGIGLSFIRRNRPEGQI